MKKTLILVVAVFGILISFEIAQASEHCTTVNTSKGVFTAYYVASSEELIESRVLDASGCDIGVYFGHDGSITNTEVYGAKHYGVFVDPKDMDIEVNISNSEFYNIGDDPFTGSQHGVAIYYYGFDTPHYATGKIINNEVYQYQKGGIVVNGKKASARVLDNVITGLDEVPFIAQNGIQFGYGSTGQIRNNGIDGNWYSGADWSSTGVLLFETNDVVVQNNIATNNQVGIAIESWCWFEPTANNNKIIRNEISDADYGISVGSVSWPGYSNCSGSSNNNKLVNNKISEGGKEGISVWAYDGSPDYDPETANNKAIRNVISGFVESIFDDGSQSKIHANVISP